MASDPSNLGGNPAMSSSSDQTTVESAPLTPDSVRTLGRPDEMSSGPGLRRLAVSPLSGAPAPFAGAEVLQATGDAPGKGRSNAEPNMASLWQAFQRCWLKTIVLALLGGGLMAGIIWAVLPPARYSTEAFIRIKSTEPYVVNAMPETRDQFLMYQRTQQTLIKSRFVLMAVLREPKVQNLSIFKEQTNPIEWLEKELTTDFTQGPEILRLSIKGDKPEETLTLITTIVDHYMELIKGEEKKERLGRLEKLKDLHETFNETLRSKRNRMQALAEAVGSDDEHVVQTQHEFAIARLHETEKALISKNLELSKLESQAKVQADRLKSISKMPIADADIDKLIRNDPVIIDYTKKIAEARSAMAQIEQISVQGKGDPKYQKIERDAKVMETAIAHRRAELEPAARKDIYAQRTAVAQTHVTELQDQIKQLKSTIQVLDKMRQKDGEETKTINKSSLELEVLKREIAQSEEMAVKVAKEIQQVQMEVGAPSRITLLQTPFYRTTNDEKIQIAATAGGGAAGFAAIALGIAFLDLRRRRIHTLDDVTAGLGLPVVGSLPSLSNRRPSRQLIGGSRSNDAEPGTLVESIDAARTILLHNARVHGTRCLMVCSSIGGEGKTTLASQLAVSLARSGRKTLLIDGDIRKPAIHQVFDVPDAPGLADLLRRETEPLDVLRTTAIPRLWVLPAGQFSEATSQALAEDHFGKIIEHAKQEFDFVIVDSSPVLSAVDPLLMAVHVDTVLFSILGGITQAPLVQAACDRLRRLDVHVLGALVSGISSGTESYGSPYPRS